MAACVIISGSPYAQGKCARSARAIAKALGATSGTTVTLFSIAEMDIHGCIGCDTCKDTGTCIYEDDEVKVHAAIDGADLVVIISPIYFAGVPSQLKALLDRFQPYFWKRQELIADQQSLPPKRPLILGLVGEGGDPYGTEAAFVTLASPLALADLGVVDRFSFIQASETMIVEQLKVSIEKIQGGEA
ncbi:flavodoxin family protein [Anaerotardibacter muris]|uniref:flavodoxin family protein n=1 Tax=Anaerotardibacter muris TaxID=2941505 RepID=UPI002040A608|nr:flavodoxin family protein [Anaerotardibacter muris]